MSGRRRVPDGLPFRVYQYIGKRVYSIGYKLSNGKWGFRYSCSVDNSLEVARTRSKAIKESADFASGNPAPVEGDFSQLIDEWFNWQKNLPTSDSRKRATSTINENLRESKNLKLAFGHLHTSSITKSMGYAYLDACLTSTDQDGRPRPRPEKGNKEIALARTLLEFAIRKGLIESNPFANLEKNKKKSTRRLVSKEELALAIEMGRKIGGPQYIVAMGLQTAFLCVRRSVEVRALTRDCISQEGILWKDGKDPTKPSILIKWTPELRATIDETLSIKRNKLAASTYLFGNMQGQKYTKGGWKASLDDLMHPCVEEARKRGIQFRRFSLQDCRPMAVTDKLTRGDLDTKDATGHTTDAMINKHYDRRTRKVATGARLPERGEVDLPEPHHLPKFER